MEPPTPPKTHTDELSESLLTWSFPGQSQAYLPHVGAGEAAWGRQSAGTAWGLSQCHGQSVLGQRGAHEPPPGASEREACPLCGPRWGCRGGGGDRWRQGAVPCGRITAVSLSGLHGGQGCAHLVAPALCPLRRLHRHRDGGNVPPACAAGRSCTCSFWGRPGEPPSLPRPSKPWRCPRSIFVTV